MISQQAIANYQTAKQHFDKATAEAQETLESCGWRWVKRWYRNSCFQYFMVSPKMFEALDLITTEADDTPIISAEPNYVHWHKNIDFVEFTGYMFF